MSADASVKAERVTATNDSSSVSKASMIARGYFHDPFAQVLLPDACTNGGRRLPRRSPQINRGYFIRVWCIDQLLWKFIAHCRSTKCAAQIVSVGAGFDSSYFRLRRRLRSDPSDVVLRYCELDLPSVVAQKVRQIEQNREQLGCTDCEFISSQDRCSLDKEYSLIACDLRDLSAFERTLACELDVALPTFFLAECVMNYLEPTASDAVLSSIASTFRLACTVVYEQILPNTAFGFFMQTHFRNVGSPLKSIQRYPDCAAEEARLKRLGFEFPVTASIGDLYYHVLPAVERARIAQLEPFDEFEAWHTKCAHYVVAVGLNDSRLADALLPDWTRLKHPAISVATTSRVELSAVTSSPLCQRYAHVGVPLSGSDALVVLSGGVGPGNGGGHRRLADVVLVNVEDARVVAYKEVAALDRVYAAACTLRGGRVLVVGGRRSPTAAALADVLILNVSAVLPEQDWVSVQVIELDRFHISPSTREGRPCGRWRHAVTSCAVSGFDAAFCGGLTDGAVLRDAWLINSGETVASRLPDLPSTLHSHSLVVWNDHLLVSGGLRDLESDISPDLLTCDLHVRDEWCSLWTAAAVQRYGHSSHVVGDRLFLVGGCSRRENCPLPDVAVMCLRSGVCFEIPLESRLEHCPFMLTNFSTVLTRTDDTNGPVLTSSGGGANCFSFGTLLNPPFVRMRIVLGDV